jgi:hypothetical protein
MLHNQSMDNNTQNAEPIAVLNGWEYWLAGEEVYRNQVGNRSYLMPCGVPANARWECSLWHFNRYIRVAA